MAARQRQQSIPASIQGPRVVLLLCALALLLIGLVMVYSASSVSAIEDGLSATREVFGQLVYAIIGIAIAVVLWKVLPYRLWLSNGIWIIWLGAVALLLLTAVAGTAEYGAKRWLSLGFIHIQPSEFVKIAFLLMAVKILSDVHNEVITVRAGLVQALIFILIPLMFLYKTQSDLGSTLICFAGIFAVMWIGGVPGKVLAVIAGVGVCFALYAVFGTGYRSDRMTYLDPWNDGEGGYGAGYNIIRSYYALAEGGLFGLGLGNSHEKFSYLFASDSDFIFAVIGEELGLVGAMVVIALFVGLLIAGLRIAQQASDDTGRMLAGGCTVILVFQAFLNIGCVIGVLPTTGKPLPFVSSGGSSLISSMIMLGLILAVSQDAQAPSVYEQRRADLRILRVSEPSWASRDTDWAPEPSMASSRRRGAASNGFSVLRGGKARSDHSSSRLSQSDFQAIRGGRGRRRGSARDAMFDSVNYDRRGRTSRQSWDVEVPRASREGRAVGQFRYYERVSRLSLPRSSRR